MPSSPPTTATQDGSGPVGSDLAAHRLSLGRIVGGEPLAVTLDRQCRMIEARFPGALCSVLLVDPDGQVLRDAAGPSLAPDYRTALDGLPIGDGIAACGTAAATGMPVVVTDVRTDHRTTAFQWVEARHGLRSVWSQPVTTATGEVLGTFAVYRTVPHQPDAEELDVVAAAATLVALAIERGRAATAMTRALQVDDVTGLANRARFIDELQGRLDQGSGQVAVAFLDLDDFKVVNDSLGHATGDGVLAQVGRRLAAALPEGGLIARFGGDEFAVMLPDPTGPLVARTVESLRAALAQPVDAGRTRLHLSASIGVAVADLPTTEDAQELLGNADAAMYVAKARRRGSHVLYDDTIRTRANDRLQLESALREGIVQDQLHLRYQPILSLRSGRVTGAEALVRWLHPQDGLVLPARFIEVSEETGLIVPLGRWVLTSAIRQAGEWLRAGTPLVVSVNVSVVQLTDPELLTVIGEGLRAHDVPAELIALEITESMFMARLAMAREVVAAARAMGLRVVIDDFGTGYSSIARLADLQVDAVKVDQSFARGLGHDEQAAEVMGAILGLARALRLATVVEGVEDAAALDQVRRLGGDLVQGHHVSRPVGAAQLARMVQGQVDGDGDA